jgi:hypothetical protein
MKGITDFHTHAYPDDLAPRAVQAFEQASARAAPAVLDGTVRDLLRSMDRAGVHRSVICPIATLPKHVLSILTWCLEVRSERLIPFGSVHPDCEDIPGTVARIAMMGLRGVKMHPQNQGFNADDRRAWPCYEAIAEHGLVLLMHAGRDLTFPADDDRADPRRILAVHESFPAIPLVAAHMGGYKRWDEVLHTLAGTQVYLETSFSLGRMAPEVLGELLEKHPLERILFGSDSPWQDQAATIELVRRTFPEPEAQNKVLCENAERLLAHGREVEG